MRVKLLQFSRVIFACSAAPSAAPSPHRSRGAPATAGASPPRSTPSRQIRNTCPNFPFIPLHSREQTAPHLVARPRYPGLSFPDHSCVGANFRQPTGPVPRSADGARRPPANLAPQVPPDLLGGHHRSSAPRTASGPPHTPPTLRSAALHQPGNRRLGPQCIQPCEPLIRTIALRNHAVHAQPADAASG